VLLVIPAKAGTQTSPGRLDLDGSLRLFGNLPSLLASIRPGALGFPPARE
jgi:hypothetical protein